MGNSVWHQHTVLIPTWEISQLKSIKNGLNGKFCLASIYQYQLETSVSKKALQIHKMANSVWHRYINTNLKHKSVKKHYKYTLNGNFCLASIYQYRLETSVSKKSITNSPNGIFCFTVWHRYINTNLRHQSVKNHYKYNKW